MLPGLVAHQAVGADSGYCVAVMSATFRPLAVLLLALAAAPAQAQQPLVPGPFPSLEGTRLGEAEVFMRAPVLPESPPARTRCAPLLDEGGAVLAWLSAADAAGGRVFVRRCVDGPAPEDGLPAGVRRGGEADEWETAARDGAGGLVTTPLGLPDSTFYSNPAFCGARVAYWAFRGDELRAQVYDLDAGAVLASDARGAIYLVADESTALDAPVWDAACGEAVFRAARLGRRAVILTLDRAG